MYLVNMCTAVKGKEYRVVLSCLDASGQLRKLEVTGKSKEYGSRQRMELVAVHAGLERMTKPSEIVIKSSSWYFKTGMEYLPSWKAQGWKKSNGKPIANAELWQRIEEKTRIHRVKIYLQEEEK